MTFEILFGAVLVAMSVALLAVTMSLSKLDKKISKIDDVTTRGLASMAQAVSDVVETTTSLSDKFNEMELDPVSKKIEEAKQEVFTEWIDNITKYNPYTGTPHGGE